MEANHDLEHLIRQLQHQLNEAKFRAETTSIATNIAAQHALDTLHEANRRLTTVRAQRDECNDRLHISLGRIAELEKQPQLPTITEVLTDPASSHWLVNALDLAFKRDPVDAANDSELLAALLRRRAQNSLT